jgi:hypothetical protein
MVEPLQMGSWLELGLGKAQGKASWLVVRILWLALGKGTFGCMHGTLSMPKRAENVARQHIAVQQ